MDKKCSICQRKFLRGFVVTGTRYLNKQDWRKEWYIGRKRDKLYICEKCLNTGAALIRNNLAIKTRDIIDE